MTTHTAHATHTAQPTEILPPMSPPPPDAATYAASALPGGLRARARRVLRESGYALTAFPVALAGFVAVVVLLSIGLGLSVLVGGLLVLTAGVLVARGFAHLERYRLRTVLDRPAPAPAYLTAAPGASFWARALTPLRDPQSWLDVGWAAVGLATGLAAFAVTLVWWVAAAGGLTYWLWQRWIPRTEDETTLVELLGLGDGRAAESLLNLAFGVAAALTLPYAVRLASTLHAGVATVLLSSRAELQREVSRVQGGRAAARVAEAASLRRLERDIHDGPQQRLVRLSMDLGRARRQLADDPARARETLDAALGQARETVAELRALSHGIAPPLLVDRGLAAALEEMALRSPVPVETRIDVPADLPPHVETAAYFVVSEALTNVAKHSGAVRATLAVTMTEGFLDVVVGDDGIGGAHPGKGLGLAGLQQRLAGVDGSLAVDSPTGGPTTVAARVPLAG